MNNERIGLYEGMFLFPQSATANLQEAIDHLKDILAKCETTIISFSKWDERRLAYEVDGNKRGVYFLVFFNAPTSKMSELERRCNQSEQVIRMMVTRAEHLPEETIKANEGAEALAKEIKVRGEQTSDQNSSASSTITRKADEVTAKPKAIKEKPVAEIAPEKTTKEADDNALEAQEAQVATETAENEEVTEA
jgi:small subunit ribosomal protein S6